MRTHLLVILPMLLRDDEAAQVRTLPYAAQAIAHEGRTLSRDEQSEWTRCRNDVADHATLQLVLFLAPGGTRSPRVKVSWHNVEEQILHTLLAITERPCNQPAIATFPHVHPHCVTNTGTLYAQNPLGRQAGDGLRCWLCRSGVSYRVDVVMWH